ncbi:MAG TPA: tagaturonate epimerase family protein [Bacteroidota bacterium]|nr:tagaturonate epimerase family protein [Bacteroidota bacterium]
MKIEQYSIGIGDRFGRQGVAQLSAFEKARAHGVEVVPVWNKSNREHTLVGTRPQDTREEADRAVKKLGWKPSYYVDADHIGIKTVEPFIASSNYFTLDVADFIGEVPADDDLKEFTQHWKKYLGTLRIPGVKDGFSVTSDTVASVGRKYLVAVQEAGKIYRYIAARKGVDKFITEVSTDEANMPQTPVELFFVLAALSREGVPLQTVAPKFSGEFLKGVDYVGDTAQFAKEFEQDLAVIAYAVNEFGLPDSLKISVHTGSDKFSIYPIINKAIKKSNAGLHLKTAGTTWLEEVIGLAKSGGNGLQIAKEVYAQSYKRYDEMEKPYHTVINIDYKKLPSADVVSKWSSEEFVGALRHDQSSPRYNNSFRQLIHIGYKVAAEMGTKFTDALDKSQNEIHEGVADNIYERHLRPIFLGND